MMRCTLPWAASRGATRKPMTSPATRASTTSHPSVRVIGSPLEDRVEREHADGDVYGVGGGQELQPVCDAAQALAGQHRLGRLHGSEEQALPAVVVALGEKRASQAHEPAQDEAKPEEPRQGVGQALAITAQRELEDEEQEEREEKERVERFLGAPLGQRVLPEHDPRAACVAHASSSAWASYRRRTSSGESVAAGVSRTTVPPARMTMRSATPSPRPKLCVVSSTVPPPALNAARYSSTHFPACWSSPANGSSSRITRGWLSVSRARARRRFMPTENVRTRA